MFHDSETANTFQVQGSRKVELGDKSVLAATAPFRAGPDPCVMGNALPFLAITTLQLTLADIKHGAPLHFRQDAGFATGSRHQKQSYYNHTHVPLRWRDS